MVERCSKVRGTVAVCLVTRSRPVCSDIHPAIEEKIHPSPRSDLPSRSSSSSHARICSFRQPKQKLAPFFRFEAPGGGFDFQKRAHLRHTIQSFGSQSTQNTPLLRLCGQRLAYSESVDWWRSDRRASIHHQRNRDGPRDSQSIVAAGVSLGCVLAHDNGRIPRSSA